MAQKPTKKAAKTAKPKAKPVVKSKTSAKTPAKKVAPKPAKKAAAKPVKKAVTKTVAPKPEVKKEAPVVKAVPKRLIKPVVKITPAPVNTDNRSRYSDAELAEFKELISGKLETSKSELKYLQEQISRSSEMGDDSDARFKGLEDGTSTSEREYLSQMASRQIQYIGHLEKAMIRIENKTYGICRETGKLISKERLRAVPHATLSIEAKQGKG
ncbi:MAG: TraR/DksA C4-type zinc finger protein [Chitinophagales bacterium]